MRKKLPEVDELIRLGKAGMTQAEIAEMFGASRHSVHSAISRSGKKWPERKNPILSMHKKGKTCAEIARDVGCTKQNVHLVLKRRGLKPNKRKK